MTQALFTNELTENQMFPRESEVENDILELGDGVAMYKRVNHELFTAVEILAIKKRKERTFLFFRNMKTNRNYVVTLTAMEDKKRKEKGWEKNDYAVMVCSNNEMDFEINMKAHCRLSYEAPEVEIQDMKQDNAITEKNFIEMFARRERLEEVKEFIMGRERTHTLFQWLMDVHNEKNIDFTETLEDLNFIRRWTKSIDIQPWTNMALTMPPEWKAKVQDTLYDTPEPVRQESQHLNIYNTKSGGDENR